jgi:hypothetical protein
MTHTGNTKGLRRSRRPCPRTVGARAIDTPARPTGYMAGAGSMVTGCGYTADSLYRKNVLTVYVE